MPNRADVESLDARITREITSTAHAYYTAYLVDGVSRVCFKHAMLHAADGDTVRSYPTVEPDVCEDCDRDAELAERYEMERVHPDSWSPQKRDGNTVCATCGKSIPKGRAFCNHMCDANYWEKSKYNKKHSS